MPEEGDLEPHEWLSLLNRGPLPYTDVAMRGQVRRCWCLRSGRLVVRPPPRSPQRAAGSRPRPARRTEPSSAQPCPPKPPPPPPLTHTRQSAVVARDVLSATPLRHPPPPHAHTNLRSPPSSRATCCRSSSSAAPGRAAPTRAARSASRSAGCSTAWRSSRRGAAPRRRRRGGATCGMCPGGEGYAQELLLGAGCGRALTPPPSPRSGRGWGVRSWDTIPCGALVAVFYGKVFRCGACP